MGSSTVPLWTGPFPIQGLSCLFLGLLLKIEIPVLHANSVYQGQTPHIAASDLGLHCLQRSHKWDDRLK